MENGVGHMVGVYNFLNIDGRMPESYYYSLLTTLLPWSGTIIGVCVHVARCLLWLRARAAGRVDVGHHTANVRSIGRNPGFRTP